MLLNEQRDQRPGEHLPCENALGNEAQRDVHALTADVALPRTYLLVLEPLVEREGVEEKEEGDDDADNEPGNLRCALRTWLKRVNEDDEPWDDSRDTPEDEGEQFSVAGLFVLLLQRSEHDHRCVDRENPKKRPEVGATRELRNEPNHDRRTQRVLSPTKVIVVVLQPTAVTLKNSGRGDEEVEERRQEQEGDDAESEVDFKEHDAFGREVHSGRAGHVVNGDGKQHGGADERERKEEGHSLQEVHSAGNDVVRAKATNLLVECSFNASHGSAFRYPATPGFVMERRLSAVSNCSTEISPFST